MKLKAKSYLGIIVGRLPPSIGMLANLEPNGISRDDGNRPGGMSLIPWKTKRALVWDATCIDTLAPSHLTRTIRNAVEV